MPIPIPVTKTPVATVPWGIPITNEVNRLTGLVDRLVQSKAHLLYSPTGAVNATTTGTMTGWLNAGNVTVPTWCTGVRVWVALLSWLENAPVLNTYDVAIQLGTVRGRSFFGVGASGGGRNNLSWVDYLAAVPVGSQAAVVYVARIAGTGSWGADTSTDLNIMFEFV